jgi:trehalose/maltose hydrolase-like predicted phosphorylase
MKRSLLFSLFFYCSVYIIAQSSTWQIKATDIDPNDYFGITVANGMVGLVSSPEPLQMSEVVLNGVYDDYQRGRVSNILKSFNHVNLGMSIDGIVISQSTVSDYQQVLDMKKAMLITQFEVGNKASVRHSIMSLRHLPFTSLIKVEVEAKEDVVLNALSMILAPGHLRDVKNFYGEILTPTWPSVGMKAAEYHERIPLLTSVAESPTGKYTVVASNSILFEEELGEQPDIIHENLDFDRHWARFIKEIKAGETYTFYVVATACTTEHYTDPHNEAERLTAFAALEGADRLLEKHTAAWEKLWESDIQIEGDPEVQRDVRSALYHLYSFARKGTAYSLSPMGLSGLGYNGHVFWDTEIWMYPPLLVLQPDIARSLLEYRFERLEAARQNAFAHGYEGAMFPWESSADGSEDTPYWALTGPFEHHITGDIGWAFWKYYQVTKDQQWLKDRGYPVLKEVADFWTSRVDRDGPGQYNIRNVIGANEYIENIDNNAFTNGIAIVSLRYAAEAARELGLTPNPDWEHVADNIPIMTFPDGTTRENSTYEGQIIKQADANLLSYPLNLVSGEDAIRRDLKYYEPKIDPNGPAMGVSVLSTLYARLKEPKKAYSLLQRSYQPNEVPPFGVLAETAGGTNPYFATGAGGMLQAVLFGFGGLEVTDKGVIQIPTQIPSNWKSLVIKGVGVEGEEFEVR